MSIILIVKGLSDLVDQTAGIKGISSESGFLKQMQKHPAAFQDKQDLL